MTNRLIEAGYIRIFNPRSRDKNYVATKKPFNIKNTKRLYKLPSSKSQRLHGICNIIQIQKCSFKADVKHPPLKDVKWDREWDLNNGVRYQQYGYPFPNIGSVKFQRIKSINKDVVKIILPRLTWENDNGDPNDFLRETAFRCASWFKKNLLIDFGELRVCQRPDFAIPLTDKHLVDLSQRGTYSNSVLSIDSSSPDNIPEIESKDYDVINGLSTVVPRVNRLERDMVEIKGIVIEIRDEFRSVFSQPGKPDNRLNDWRDTW